ncbi:MAG: response regulator transcription factor [Pedococcus sp.]
MTSILVAEDVPQITRFLEKGLRAEGYSTHAVADGSVALDLASHGRFDLMLLDLGLPGMDGFTVLIELRRRQVSMPVIVLTARDAPDDVVAGLEGGADDYMSKPFRLAELLARIRLRLRDVSFEDVLVLAQGDLRLDLRTHQASVRDRTVTLSPREFGLLQTLMRHPDLVLSREQLLNDVWGFSHDTQSNVVDVYVRYLRRKVGHDRIRTHRGWGYQLVTTPGRPGVPTTT